MPGRRFCLSSGRALSKPERALARLEVETSSVQRPLGLKDLCIRNRVSVEERVNGERREKKLSTNPEETVRHSYASHAVLTAPPPDRDAIRMTPGTQTRERRALTRPAERRESVRILLGCEREKRTEVMRAFNDELFGNDGSDSVEEEEVDEERDEGEDERPTGACAGPVGEEEAETEWDDEDDEGEEG